MSKRSLFLIWVMAVFTATTSTAATWIVAQDGSGDFLTIQPAVGAAASGDTITIEAGIYEEMIPVVKQSGEEIQVFGYWDNAKDLVFLGAGADVVTIGPVGYTPDNFAGSPVGIFSEESNRIVVSGISFRNLYWSVVNLGDAAISDCSFVNGEEGAYILYGDADVRRCRFENFDNAVLFAECDTARVGECYVSHAKFHFKSTSFGEMRGCTVEGGAACYYSHSGGAMLDNIVNGSDEPCFSCNECDVAVTNSTFVGGYTSLTIRGVGASVEAYGNVFARPEYWHFDMLSYASLNAYGNDIYRDPLGPEYFLKVFFYYGLYDASIDVRNNHWGEDSAEHMLAMRIWDGNDDPDEQIFVEYMPISTEPLEAGKKSLGGFKSMFR